MSSPTVVLTIWCLLAFAGPRPPAGAGSVQIAQPTPTPAPPAKPCPAVSPSTPASTSDCPPPSKRKHKRSPAQKNSAGPTKTVVRNGSTSDPTLAIAPSVSQQQASQQLGTTNDLVAMTEENLKIVASRQLNASQQDTVEQIKSYIKQSRKAEEDKDVQRAYNLANKARMLSGDLVKHSGPAFP